MKMTQTPFADKIDILTKVHFDYGNTEDEDVDFSALEGFYNDESNKDIFALALSVKVGRAVLTDSGTEVINVYFDEICRLTGNTEDVPITYDDLYK
jgi:hypothetical protein